MRIPESVEPPIAGLVVDRRLGNAASASRRHAGENAPRTPTCVRRVRSSIITYGVIILSVAIRTFKCADTEALFGLRHVARFANIERPALRKLKQLDLARRIEDLRAPPANRLEQLKGDRAGQWSLRVNDQLRICFRWTGSDAEDVEIVDYH
jgi:proteic killer suppression protein